MKPSLRFSPTAWGKLLFLRDCGDTEVGGFGISVADDLFFVTDIQLVRQRCTPATVAFVDDAVADFFDRQVDEGRQPAQFGRIWIHTHPGTSPYPSVIDEQTFERVFGRVDWAVMFILARGGKSYARLKFNIGPGGTMIVPVETDFRAPFAGSDQAAWQAEYLANVETPDPFLDRFVPAAGRTPTDNPAGANVGDWFDLWFNDEYGQQQGRLLA